MLATIVISLKTGSLITAEVDGTNGIAAGEVVTIRFVYEYYRPHQPPADVNDRYALVGLKVALTKLNSDVVKDNVLGELPSYEGSVFPEPAWPI
ncbi:hypothetical protein A2Z33_00255 [Candidatus Gottesmanbacteria bacterium RBG_16_52_11]|uniref:Uncharacterized protein n=1 Tax=Candidatus Gottesmanbacteria bacterium RBG_16_52_11 TaxID=1798374 RepID=A0A1F5YP59_9BACT|nr:MAG: hypothetical protein A2Z33_00255 [Candidatus Gottesmanbacteria bacterium RBG_16_52_11]